MTTATDAASRVDQALADNPLTEDALALRFADRHAQRLRYVAVKNQWFEWDGNVWRPEQTHHVYDLARDSCREDARAFSNGKRPEKPYTAKTVAAVTWLARADRRQAMRLDQFDANNWAITC